MNPEDAANEAAKVSIVVSCLVVRDGKYLMVQEEIPERGALWHPPSGKTDVGEDLESAAVRWTKLQTGYDARPVKEVGLYHEVAAKSIKHVYSAEIVGGELGWQEPGVLKVEWLSYSDIELLNTQNALRAPWVWSVIQKTRTRANEGSADGALKYL